MLSRCANSSTPEGSMNHLTEQPPAGPARCQAEQFSKAHSGHSTARLTAAAFKAWWLLGSKPCVQWQLHSLLCFTWARRGSANFWRPNWALTSRSMREASSWVAWEGLSQLRSQVPASADGSLEALITGTLSELLLPQWKTRASFQGSC